jgi:hypothetical protein
MAASTKKAKPKDKLKSTAKVPKAATKPVKASLKKSVKVKSGKSLPAKSGTRDAIAKTAAKKPAPKPTKPAAKKAAGTKKEKSAPVAKSPAKANPVKVRSKSVIPTPVRKENNKQLKKKDLTPVSTQVKPPIENPVSTTRPIKPQVVITKPRPSLRQILPPPPSPPTPKPEVRKPASAAALRAFEQAVKIFNRRQFEEAQELFEHLQQKFPHEAELLGRSQMYLQVCHQKLATAPPAPVRNVSADELYDRGVYALNVGDFAQARSFFEKALRLNPNEPHFLYSLAATYAQTGSHEQALDYLRRSIQIQPRFRSQAFDDADFSDLRENRQFQELLGLTSPFDLLEARR